MLLIGAGRNAKARQDRDRMDILQLSFFAAVLTLGILNADAADCGRTYIYRPSLSPCAGST